MNMQQNFAISRLCTLLLVTSLACSAIGQQPPPSTPQIFEMTVSPAAEPSPALRYSLLPPYADKQPGNAATYYMRAILMRVGIRDIDRALAESEDRWLQWPPEPAHQEEIRKWLRLQQPVFDDIRKAAYRDDCDWGLRLLDLRGRETINLRLHDVQETRSLARALRYQARLAIAEGRLEDALESLRQGYQLAYDVNRQATLVNGLVGVAIADMMHNELQLLVQDKNAPNLYWAMAALPHPLIDLRKAIEQERNFVFQLFPALKDAETAEHAAEEWQQLLESTVSELNAISSSTDSPDNAWTNQLMLAYAALNYPRAKKALIGAGLPAEQVEAMPVAQVLLVQTARTTRYLYDETFKWSYLPYIDAQWRLAETRQRLLNTNLPGPNTLPGTLQSNAALPIADLLLPAIESATFAPIREQRRLVALHTIEAIRMYAAANDGKLPNELTDITQVPLPRDPLTGAPLRYQVDGNAGVIDVPPRSETAPSGEAYRYIVRIRN